MTVPQTPGVPDHAAVVETVGLSPKAIASTVVGGLLGVVVALLNGVQDNPDLLGGLPTWLQSVILIVIPPLLAGFAAYQASPGAVTVKRS